MAAIDKIYGTLSEYDQLHDWLRSNRPKYLVSLYERRTDVTPNESRPIAIFSEVQDGIMLLECPLKFVIEQIIEQYSLPLKYQDTEP